VLLEILFLTGAANNPNQEGQQTSGGNADPSAPLNPFGGFDILTVGAPFNPIQNQLKIFDTIKKSLLSALNFGGQFASADSDLSGLTKAQTRDFNRVLLSEASTGRTIDLSRSVAAVRLGGGDLFSVTSPTTSRTRIFASEGHAAEFLRRIG